MNQSVEFLKLEVENIFAYKGRSTIDLSGCTDDQNIIVISGPNGSGKTSLLNAIKLLFLGAETDSMRKVGWQGGGVSYKQYVLGQPGTWFGVFNQFAHKREDIARVAISWTADGDDVNIERRFTMSPSSEFSEALHVTVAGKQLTEDEGKDFVAGLAPQEIVPFYFFDGEQVQSFADAEEGRARLEIERLLGLWFVNELSREVDTVGKAKRRAELSDDVRSAIVKAESSMNEAQAHLEASRRARIDIEETQADLERQKDRLDDRRNALRVGISETDRRKMVQRIEALKIARETLSAELLNELPPEAPWLANLALVRRAFETLDSQYSLAIDGTLANTLTQDLPGALINGLSELAPPVVLTAKQRTQFIESVRGLLAEKGVNPDGRHNKLLSSLSPRLLRQLRDRYLVWADSGPGQASSQVDKLRRMRTITRDHIQSQRDLDDAELSTDEARHNFDALTNQIKNLESEIQDCLEQAARLTHEERVSARSAEDARGRISELEKRYADAAQKNRQYQIALRVNRALDWFKESRRQAIRRSVEVKLSERIVLLLGPTQLIKAVTLDDFFVMRYFDERGDEVARRSISAGMRQLVAIGMLWALKEEAGRPLPVVIDTPLGRIDKANRNLLMSQYFPNAGKPLLVLPTDTEMDSDVLGSLGNRVKRRYVIRNDGGKAARIEEIPVHSMAGL